MKVMLLDTRNRVLEIVEVYHGSVNSSQVHVGELFKRYKYEFSGADLEAVLIRAKFLSAMNNHVFVTKGDLEETIRDFMPPAYPHEIELQNLVAVLECTSKEMVPKRFQNLDRTKLVKDIRELKALLGERQYD